MRGAAICSKGAEKIAAAEIAELAKAKDISPKSGYVEFETDHKGLMVLSYKGQSVDRVLLLLADFRVSRSIAKEPDFGGLDLSLVGSSFCVECTREGVHDFNSVDFAALTTKIISRKTKKKVDYDNPQTIVHVHIEGENGIIGIDFSGFDLSRRYYKIFNHPESLRATTAYSLLRYSGYKGSKSLIDPFMGSGVIVIEAALYATGFPVQYYNKDKLAFTRLKGFDPGFFEREDKVKLRDCSVYGLDHQLRYLKASQKNAKLAGIDKHLNLSKSAVEWLDIRFEKGALDFIVSDPPRMSKSKEAKLLAKTYGEFFYQAEYVLKKTGVIGLLTKDYDVLLEEAQKHKFKLIEHTTLSQGKDSFNMLLLRAE